ncbi:DUF6191 domain-containing protein [Kitasatospora sp. NPDC096140]|uniref:DUF6191 domain-containing protein n=1 Tax=Kitasatospora sp. NPDC096140 TaxID=3155425 RepID=UPI0033317D64
MGLIVGVVATVAALLGLAALAVWQIRDEASPRPRQRGPGVAGLGAGGLDELHALFSPGKRIQVEQKKERLALRDDAQAGSPPHFGVDLDRGVAVLRGGAGEALLDPAPRGGAGESTPGQAPRDGSGTGPAGQAPQVREQSTSR